MSDPRLNNRDMITAIIETSSALPALWQKNHKQYMNRNVKINCFGKLSEVMKQWIPESTPTLARAKWNNLKTAYMRQKKEIDDSQRNGVGGDDVKTPTLWYYHLMQFLNESLEGRQNKVSMESESVSSGSEKVSIKRPPEDEESLFDVQNATVSQEVSQTPPVIKRRRWESLKSLRQKKDRFTNLSLSDPVQKLRTSNECFSEFIGKELDELDKTQVLYAKKLIHDVIFYGRQNLLSGTTALHFQTIPVQLQPTNVPTPVAPPTSTPLPQMSAHTLPISCGPVPGQHFMFPVFPSQAADQQTA